MTQRPEREEVEAPDRRINWPLIALVGGLLILAVAYFVTRGDSNQDKLTGNEVATTAAPSREKLCASSATYDQIKRDLFRRAAQLRGADAAAFDQIAAAAVVRMENPVMESEDTSTQAVNCSGSLSLDLPPGVAVSGDRRTLMSDVDYGVQQAADNSGPVVTVHNADAIIQPLSTLARVEQPAPAATVQPTNSSGAENSDEAAPAAPAPAPEAAPSPPAAARASFDCGAARTSGERAVCAEPSLGALDRAMASEYGRAFAVSTPEQRDQLRQSAHRFYAYRDRCADRQCIADAYAGRIREIRDIVQGRWQPR